MRNSHLRVRKLSRIHAKTCVNLLIILEILEHCEQMKKKIKRNTS